MKILCIGNGTLSVAHQELAIAAALKNAGHEVLITHDMDWGFFKTPLPAPLVKEDLIYLKHGEYKLIEPKWKPDIMFGMDQSVTPFVHQLKQDLKCPAAMMFLDFPKHVIDEGDAVNYNPDYSRRFYGWLSQANDLEALIFNNRVSVDQVKKMLNREVSLVWYPLCNWETLVEADHQKRRDEDPYVVSCHRFVAYKGTDYLIKSLYGIDVEYKAICVGGNLVDQIIGFAKDMLEDNFTMMLRAEEMAKADTIRHASVLVYPQTTNWVGGLSPLESMALKTPVICFDYPVLRELYGDCAIYAKPRDIDDLQQKILSVLNKDYDGSIEKRAFERVITKFTPNEMAKRLIKIFEGVI